MESFIQNNGEIATLQEELNFDCIGFYLYFHKHR